ncbi:hypothetical protein [Catelliglobosispora koreensis]|uniref:hypothetical protein n=1 Tax=Catelliglobosispora koreensis TaxID=129052 RepID=UPI0012FBC049|nr:hypothetical protein [Catelliglobosispora koreensis]
MTTTIAQLIPVWHARIEPQSAYNPAPVFRAAPALLDSASDRLTSSSLRTGLEHLDYFQVRAYIEPSETGPRMWGFEHGYSAPHFVNLWRAEPMVKTLRRIEKGLRAHETRFGSIGVGDGVGYLAVIASIVKVERFVIEGDQPDGMWMSGVRYRDVDAGTLKSIISDRVERLDLH